MCLFWFNHYLSAAEFSIIWYTYIFLLSFKLFSFLFYFISKSCATYKLILLRILNGDYTVDSCSCNIMQCWENLLCNYFLHTLIQFSNVSTFGKQSPTYFHANKIYINVARKRCATFMLICSQSLYSLWPKRSLNSCIHHKNLIFLLATLEFRVFLFFEQELVATNWQQTSLLRLLLAYNGVYLATFVLKYIIYYCATIVYKTCC